MALIENGRARMGETLSFPLEGKVVTARIVDPVFYDKEGTPPECLSRLARRLALGDREGRRALACAEIASRGMIDLRGLPTDGKPSGRRQGTCSASISRSAAHLRRGRVTRCCGSRPTSG